MTVLSRRSLLSAGLAVTAAAGGGAAYRGWRYGSFDGLADGPAFQPWADWSSGRYQGPLALVAAAVLAASPHNSQPWRFRVLPDRVLLRADFSRSLGPIDPFRREMRLGLGCALENMMIAARDRGYDATLTLTPGGGTDSEQIAAIDLAPGPVPREVAPRLLAIGTRHTHRGAYDPRRPVPSDSLDAFAACVEDDQTVLMLFPADSERGRDFAAATIDATGEIVADSVMHRASHAWFRQRREDIARHRDGFTVASGGGSELGIRVALALPDIGMDRFGRFWIDATRSVHCATAPLFGLIAVRAQRDQGQLLRAGRLWQRLHLEASARGIAMQPLNQAMEMADRERQFNRPPVMAERLAAVLGDPGWITVFGFRAGYAATPARPSPRRDVEEVTRSTDA